MTVDGKTKVLVNGKPIEGFVSIDYCRESDEDIKERIKRRLLAPGGPIEKSFGVVPILPYVDDKIEFELTLDDRFTDGIRNIFATDEEIFHHRAARAVRELKKIARRRRMARKRRRGWA